jgi:outer membrane receptor for ferrienterochelin and colicins
VNDEKALVKGVEVSLNSKLGAGFSLGGSYMYAHAENKDIEMGWRPIERSIRHSGSINGNYTKSWDDYTLNVNLNGRLQSRRTHISTSNVDTSAPGYGLWNLSTRHIFSGFQNFTLEPGVGINNIFDRVDNRPYGSNFSNLSPGRTIYVSMLIRFKK